MYQEEKSFLLSFNLEASFPDDYEGQDDEYAWLQDWNARVKPELLKVIFESLRRHPSWNAHIRNRGKSTHDEIEIVLSKDFTGNSSKPNPLYES